MEALYHQHINYLAAKAAEKTLTLALRWMNEGPSSDLLYTVALLQRTVTRIERIIAFAESLGSVEDNSEQQKMWHQIRTVVRSISKRLGQEGGTSRERD